MLELETLAAAEPPCLKHAGTPGRRRDSIKAETPGQLVVEDAGTVASTW